MRIHRFAFACAALSAALLAPRAGDPQEPARPEPPQDETPQFRTGAEVVLLDVVVRDKRGRTVRDLRPDELEVYEDGVRQQVVSFRLRAAGVEEPPAPEAPGRPAASPKAADESTHANLVTLVFDQLGANGRGVARRAGLALAALGEDPDLLVSVFRIRESLQLVQQFTKDRRLVEDAVIRATGEVNTQYANATEDLEKAVARERELRERFQAGMASASGPQEIASVASLGRQADMARMAIDALRMTQSLQREQQGHSSLFSLLALSRQQQRLSGRKTILFFSEGIQVPPSLEHVLSSAVSEANRANVSIYAVDARGLSDERQLEETGRILSQAASAAQHQNTRMAGAVSREEVMALETAESAIRMDVQGALADLAVSTGGQLIANTNDVSRGIERAVGDLRGYYEVVYAPAKQEYDGRFRRVEVKLKRPNVAVQARSGYFALPPGEGTATFPYEVDLLRALRVHPAPRDFALEAALFGFGPEGGGRRHSLAVEVPLSGIELQPEERGDSDRAHVSMLAVLRDATGVVRDKFSQDSPMFLPHGRREELRRGNAVFLRSFALPEGRYTLEVAVVDQLAHRYSVRRQAVEVRVPASGLTLSQLAFVKRTEAVPQGALESEDPFRQGATRIVPFVGECHVRVGEELAVFAVAYPRPDRGAPRVMLELLREGQVAAQSLSDLPQAGEGGRVPYLASVPMSALPPGRYEVRLMLQQGGLIAVQKAEFVLDQAGGEDARRPAAEARPAGTKEDDR